MPKVPPTTPGPIIEHHPQGNKNESGADLSNLA